MPVIIDESRVFVRLIGTANHCFDHIAGRHLQQPLEQRAVANAQLTIIFVASRN